MNRRDVFPIPLHLAIGWSFVVMTLWMVGYKVPASVNQIGASYLIFFFHFPSAVNCLNFFIFAGILSLDFVVRRRPKSDFRALAAVEVGMLACTITLATGSIWARAAWNIWWDMRDKRLMSVAVMWLTYAGYLALRGAIDDPVKRSRFGGVYGIVAAINVPLVYFSIRLFGVEHHPMNIDLTETWMVRTRWYGALAFLVLYAAFFRLRARTHEARHALMGIEEELVRSGL